MSIKMTVPRSTSYGSILLILIAFIAVMLFGSGVASAQSGGISGRLWQDANTNGVIDGGETGISGVTIVLYDVANDSCQSIATDGNGDYSFTGLSDGDYRIYETSGETTPAPAVCPPTESIADATTATVTPGTIADPANHASSTANRIDAPLSGADLTSQNFGDYPYKSGNLASYDHAGRVCDTGRRVCSTQMESMMKTETQVKQQPTYEAPRLTHKGQLKQFAGSPLGKHPEGNPLDLPGQ